MQKLTQAECADCAYKKYIYLSVENHLVSNKVQMHKHKLHSGCFNFKFNITTISSNLQQTTLLFLLLNRHLINTMLIRMTPLTDKNWRRL